MDKNFKLTPDQFDITEDGILLVDHDEIAELARREEVVRPEAASVSITISIS